MITLMVSVLSLRISGPDLLLEPIACRCRECMLRCFFKPRTGLILKESVPRLR
jgi:hypothetical protein